VTRRTYLTVNILTVLAVFALMIGGPMALDYFGIM
jgi:hypothetical protein